MSRLGKAPISVPKGVKVKVADGLVMVEGPKGSLSYSLKKGFSLRLEEDHVFIDANKKEVASFAFYGLTRSLVSNMIQGVSSGFEKSLSLVGVGYRAAVQGNFLDLQLGFSHPTKLPIPESVQVTVEKSVLIKVTGIDKQLVGQFAAEVRALRPPEPYKGKGVRYENEHVRKKAGKAAKGKG